MKFPLERMLLVLVCLALVVALCLTVRLFTSLVLVFYNVSWSDSFDDKHAVMYR